MVVRLSERKESMMAVDADRSPLGELTMFKIRIPTSFLSLSRTTILPACWRMAPRRGCPVLAASNGAYLGQALAATLPTRISTVWGVIQFDESEQRSARHPSG